MLWGACSDGGPLFPANEPPAADAGEDQLVEPGTPVRLDGGGSRDQEGETLDFAWSLVSGPAWVAITAADRPQAEVTLVVAGEYVFRLTVTDPPGATDRDEVRVFVASPQPPPPNAVPRADAGSDAITSVGLETVLDGSASSDPDDDELIYAWVQVAGPPVAIVEGHRDRARVTPPAQGEYTFRLTVIDARGGSAQDEVRITAMQPVVPNGKPTADAGSDHVIFVGDTATLDARASSDPDGDNLSFAWIQLEGPLPIPITDAAAAIARITPTEPGVYVFRLTVSDGLGASAQARVQVTARAATGQVWIEAVFGEDEDG